MNARGVVNQDKEREALPIHELPSTERDEAIRAFEAAHGGRFAAGLVSDRAWVEGYAHARAALASQQAVKGEPQEMSPEFTDSARAALLWVLWHHQGASSKIGQPIRFALGMGQYDRLTEHQVKEAKRWNGAYPDAPAASPPSREPLTPQAVEALVIAAGYEYGVLDPERAAFTAGIRCGERAHGIHSRGEGEKA